MVLRGGLKLLIDAFSIRDLILVVGLVAIVMVVVILAQLMLVDQFETIKDALLPISSEVLA